MTEKVAKKIGEAYAFAQVLTDTFESNTEVMTTLFGEHAGSILDVTQVQREELAGIANTAGMSEIVLPKAEKTGAKITKMGDMYVGDDWDDVAEVLEWMSFFIGGAIVHWQLIGGAANEMNHNHFEDVSVRGAEYYVALMDQLRDYSLVVGKERAQA